MPKVSEEAMEARRQEIIDACAELYETRSFKDITIKDIGERTSLNRSSLYNYFQTKEEIFLAIFQREHEQWTAGLNALTETAHPPETGRVEAFAEAIAASLKERKVLLKLLSMNLYDMEENSRMEHLVAFKRTYGQSVAALDAALHAFFPQMGEAARASFQRTFFPFLYGIYPYTFATAKQEKAMRKAGVTPSMRGMRGVQELVCQGIGKMLRGDSPKDA